MRFWGIETEKPRPTPIGRGFSLVVGLRIIVRWGFCLFKSKIELSQFCKFFYVLGAYDGADEGRLRSGMYLIEVLLGCGLGDEHFDALAKCTVNQQIWIRITSLCKTFAFMRRPFSQ